MDETIFVDIPNPHKNGEWINVGQFKTKAEAVAWIREWIGQCDDDGNINLLTVSREEIAGTRGR